MKTSRLLLAAALAVAAPALAEGGAVPYYFGTNETRTLIQFESETSVETIHGVVRAMSGAANLDFDKGEGSVEFRIPVKKLDTGLEARNGHLFSDGWLDAEKFPDIVLSRRPSSAPRPTRRRRRRPGPTTGRSRSTA